MDLNPVRRSSMTLFSDPGDHDSHCVRMVLAEKDVFVEVVDVKPGRRNQKLLDANTYHSVPTLVDRDLVLDNSNVIIEYIDERFPHPPLLSVYPVERAKSRLLMHRIKVEWGSNLAVLMRGKGGARVLDRAHKALRESVINVAPAFGEKPYFLSDEFTLLDCCVAPVLWRLQHVNVDLPARLTRPMARYMQKIFARRSFRDSLTELEVEMRE